MNAGKRFQRRGKYSSGKDQVMLLNRGENIFVAHRRLFEKDGIRFFVGRVDHFEDGIVRATGRSYLRDNFTGAMLEKPEVRTKLLSIVSGTLIVYVIPETVSVRESSSVWRPAIATLVPTAGHAHVCERLRNRIAEAGALVVFGGSIEP